MNYYNQKTRITASTIGVLLGIAGLLNHGIFEVLQGNTPTNGFFIEAIGKANRFWVHGTEGAFTIIPNFLVASQIVDLPIKIHLITTNHRIVLINSGMGTSMDRLVGLSCMLFLPRCSFSAFQIYLKTYSPGSA